MRPDQHNGIIVRDRIEDGCPDAVRGLDARYNDVGDAEVPEHQVEFGADERAHPDLRDRVSPGSGVSSSTHAAPGILHGKRLFPEEFLAGDLDIGTVAGGLSRYGRAGDSCPECREHITDLRDYGTGRCHPEGPAFQDEIVLHIDDQQCGFLHGVSY